MTPHQQLRDRVARAQRIAKGAGLKLIPLSGGQWCLYFVTQAGERCPWTVPSLAAAEFAVVEIAKVRADMRSAAALFQAQDTARKATRHARAAAPDQPGGAD